MFNQAYQNSFHIHAFLFELKLKLTVNTWLDPKKNFFKNPTWLTHGMHPHEKISKLFVLEYTPKKIFFKKTKLTCVDVRLRYPENNQSPITHTCLEKKKIFSNVLKIFQVYH